MCKNLKLCILNIKAYPLLKWGIISHLTICIIIIGLFILNQNKIVNLVEKNINANNRLVESISIVNEKSGQHHFVAKSTIIKPLKKKQTQEYKDFMEKYYEHQSTFLNIWLTMLAIILGVLGIIAPICFVKFFEDKKKEMDKIIRECKKQKEQTIVNMETIKKQLDEVKIYVDKAKASERISEANSNFSIANSYGNRKEYEQAIPYFNRAIEMCPDMKEAYFYIAYTYYKLKKYQESIYNYNRAETLGYDKKLILINRGIAHTENGDYDKALEDLENAKKLDPQNIITILNLSDTYVKTTKYNKAIEICNEIINNNISGKEQLYYNLTEAYLWAKEYQKALSTLNLYTSNKSAFIINDDIETWKSLISELDKESDVYKQFTDIIDNKLQHKNRDDL